MFGKCKVCGQNVGFFNLNGGKCKPCLSKEDFIAEKLEETSLFTELDLDSELHGKSLEWQLGLLSGWPGEYVDEVKRLIAEGAEINSSNADSYPHGPPLYSASTMGHLKIVKALLNNEADPNST